MVILFYSLLGVESAVKTGPPPVKGWGLWVVVFMPRLSSLIMIMVGIGVIIVIINDPWSSRSVCCRQININCGHHRCRHQLWSSSSLAVVVAIIGVITTGVPSTAPGLIGLLRLKHLTGYKSFMWALLLASGHRGAGSRSGGQLSNRRIIRGRSSCGRCTRQVSTLPVAQQVKVNGSE